MNSQEDIFTQRIQKIKDWCNKNGISYHIDTKGIFRNFTIGKNKKGERLIGIIQVNNEKGNVYAKIADKTFPGTLIQRNILVDELKKIKFYDYDFDPSTQKDCKAINKKLQKWTEDELDKFLYIIGRVYNNKTSSDEDTPNSLRPTLTYGDYLPIKEDVESAYDILVSRGEEIDIELILNQIEINATKSGRNLKANWRLITERNIKEIWWPEKFK